MSQPTPDHEQFHRLLSGWCEGSLSDAEVEQLDELLRTSPDFQRFYVAYMDQHAVLVADLIPAASPLLTEEFIRMLEDESGQGAGRRATLPVGVVRRLLPGWSRTASRSWRWWAVAVAAVLLVGLTVRLWPRGPKEIPLASQSQPPPRVRVGAIALVVKRDAVRWDQTKGPPLSEGDVLAPGRRIGLLAGRVVLALFRNRPGIISRFHMGSGMAR